MALEPALLRFVNTATSVIELPESVTALIAARARTLEWQQLTLLYSVGAPREHAVEVGSKRLVELLRAGEPADPSTITEDVEAVELEVERAQRRGSIVRLTLERVETDLASAVLTATKEILESLRHALNEVMSETEAEVAKLKGADLSDPDQALSATTSQKDAWRSLDALFQRYTRIRAVQKAAFNDYTSEVSGPLREFQNISELWPDFAAHPDTWPTVNGVKVAPEPPWPNSGPAYMMWMIRSKATAWIPTDEQAAELQQRRLEELRSPDTDRDEPGAPSGANVIQFVGL